ncbi:MAG: structural protein [Sphingobacteriia bacterium]|nr:structural protein [Sphingobacteriia bacterium]
MTQPRGIRNNNPGNIRWGQKWQGMRENGREQDSSFCVFKSPEYGIRALAKLLQNYQTLYGLNTPRKIISRYAPPNENQTQAYIQSVALQLGIQPDSVVDLTHEGTLMVFIKAIIRFENGIQPYSNETILKGIELL